MRCGELLALQWCDFERKTLNIRKSIWHQHLGPVKTDESEKVMPLDEEMITDLLRWRCETAYAGDQDWIFAGTRMAGRQPLWPEGIMRDHIRPAGQRAKITKWITWHVFRHTFSTMLAENDEDVKTVQFAHAPRQQQHHHEHLHPRGQQQKAAGADQGGRDDPAASRAAASGGRLTCIFYVSRQFSERLVSLLE
jgi:integrase